VSGQAIDAGHGKVFSLQENPKLIARFQKTKPIRNDGFFELSAIIRGNKRPLAQIYCGDWSEHMGHARVSTHPAFSAKKVITKCGKKKQVGRSCLSLFGLVAG